MQKELKESYFSDKSTQGKDKFIVSVQIELNGFSFCVVNEYSEVIFAQAYSIITFSYKEIFNVLIAEFKNVGFSTNAFKSITFYTYSRNTVLMPDELYSPDITNKVMNFSFSDLYNTNCYSDHLLSFPIYLLYSIDKELLNDFSNYFQPDTVFVNSTSRLIDSIYKDYSLFDLSKTVFINFLTKDIEILALDYQNLKFYNNFQYSTPQDVLYYLSIVLKELEIDLMDAEVVALGNIEINGLLVDFMSKYVHSFSIADACENPELMSLPISKRHLFYNLLHLSI